MDWVDGEGRAPSGRQAEYVSERPTERPTQRPAPRESWREIRGDYRPNRKGLEERLEGWMTRGRELVDGVSGTRPGIRPSGRGVERPGGGAERPGSGQGGLDGLGRWVEGRLDWLLDDRDDWREPWQEGDRPSLERWEAPPPASRRSKVPLEAISRRGAPGVGAAAPSRRPSRSDGGGLEPSKLARIAIPEPDQPPPAPGPSTPAPSTGPSTKGIAGTGPSGDTWPEAETFTVPRWRREESPPQQAPNPLADPAPQTPPGRPLPRSTRRR